MAQFALLTNAGIEQDLSSALAHLRGRGDVDPARVGSVGFCVGGFAAFLDSAHEIVVYDGAKHAFFNDLRPTAYHPEVAQAAWERTLAWFSDVMASRSSR